MYNAISGDNFNELALNAYATILDDGRPQWSRNGNVRCINNAVLNLKYPQNRHLYLEGRKSNIIAQIAETFWVMAGDDRVSPYLDFFLPRAPDYSDDGIIWRGAYGPRLYMYEQLQEAIEVFKTDGLTTRQSVIQILLPELDAKNQLVDSNCEDLKSTKDRPCNNEIIFFCIPEEDGSYSLNMNVMQRSGDAIWGALNINVFEWTFLQELVANTLDSQHEETITLGEYTHFVSNLHIYDNTGSQAVAALEAVGADGIDAGCLETHKKYHELITTMNYAPLIATGDVDNDRAFFEKLVSIFSNLIADDDELVDVVLYCSKLHELFNYSGVPIADNIMWNYAVAVFSYILQKKEAVCVEHKYIWGATNNPILYDFELALRASSFYKLIN